MNGKIYKIIITPCPHKNVVPLYVNVLDKSIFTNKHLKRVSLPIFKKKKEVNNKLDIKEIIMYILIVIVILLIKKFIISPIRVNGASMNDTLNNGDIMIMNIIGYKFQDIKRFDIVIVDEGSELIIKRVIGLPGETVEYRDNNLYINGKKMNDKYGSNKTNDFSYKVPKGEYFVLGDNRGNSMDSRVFGSFSKRKILGKTKLTIFPFSRFGNKE